MPQLPNIEEKIGKDSNGKDIIISYPHWLFCEESQDLKSISPAATLDVVSAVAGGQAFKTSTSPKETLVKRKLILSRALLSQFSLSEIGDIIAFIKRIKLAGFDVYLCCQSEIIEVADNLIDINKKILEIADFKDSDYKKLALLGAERDRSLVLQEWQVRLFSQCFMPNFDRKRQLRGNEDWRGYFSDRADAVIEDFNKRYNEFLQIKEKRVQYDMTKIDSVKYDIKELILVLNFLKKSKDKQLEFLNLIFEVSVEQDPSVERMFYSGIRSFAELKFFFGSLEVNNLIYAAEKLFEKEIFAYCSIPSVNEIRELLAVFPEGDLRKLFQTKLRVRLTDGLRGLEKHVFRLHTQIFYEAIDDEDLKIEIRKSFEVNPQRGQEFFEFKTELALTPEIFLFYWNIANKTQRIKLLNDATQSFLKDFSDNYFCLEARLAQERFCRVENWCDFDYFEVLREKFNNFSDQIPANLLIPIIKSASSEQLRNSSIQTAIENCKENINLRDLIKLLEIRHKGISQYPDDSVFSCAYFVDYLIEGFPFPYDPSSISRDRVTSSIKIIGNLPEIDLKNISSYCRAEEFVKGLLFNFLGKERQALEFIYLKYKIIDNKDVITFIIKELNERLKKEPQMAPKLVGLLCDFFADKGLEGIFVLGLCFYSDNFIELSQIPKFQQAISRVKEAININPQEGLSIAFTDLYRYPQGSKEYDWTAKLMLTLFPERISKEDWLQYSKNYELFPVEEQERILPILLKEKDIYSNDEGHKEYISKYLFENRNALIEFFKNNITDVSNKGHDDYSLAKHRDILNPLRILPFKDHLAILEGVSTKFFQNKFLTESKKSGYLTSGPKNFLRYLHENWIQEPTRFQTYFRISELQSVEQIAEIERRFPQEFRDNIVALDIGKITCHLDVQNKSILRGLFNLFPNIRHAVVDRESLGFARSVNGGISVSEHSTELDLFSIQPPAQFDTNLPPRIPKATHNVIRIAADNNKSSKLDTSNNTSSFMMFQAGEVLNNEDFPVEIRTAVLRRTNILQNLQEELIVAKTFENLTGIQVLSDDEIKGFRRADKNQNLYFLLRQKIQKGVKTRLLSVNAAETFMGVIGASDGLSIARGKEDGFLYAEVEEDRVLEYVVSINTLEKTKYEDVSAELVQDEMQRIIAQYKENQLGQNVDNLLEEYQESNHAEWMEKLFRDANGACRHRVAALEFKLRQAGIDEESFRAININNNHEILEIKHNNRWISVDLGGIEAQLHDANDDEVYESKAENAASTALSEAEEAENKRQAQLALEVAELEKLQREAEDAAANIIADERKGNAPSATPEQIASRQEEQLAKLAKIKAQAEELARKQAELKRLEKKRIEARLALIAEMQKTTILVALQDEEVLLTEVMKKRNHEKSLIVTKSDQEAQTHALFLIEKAKQYNHKTFYLNSNDQTLVDALTIDIRGSDQEKSSEIFLKSGNSLADFLNQESRESDSDSAAPILIINWDSFSIKQRLALNTILDVKRTINGIEIPQHIKIISLSSKEQRDISFLSRHDFCARSNLVLEPESQQPFRIAGAIDRKPIDLKGFPDWRKAFFGPITLVNNEMQWQKSDFVRAIEQGEAIFKISNISPENATELEKEIRQAKACGEIFYHGYRISLEGVRNLQIEFGDNSYDFNKFQEIIIAKNVTFDKCPENTFLSNTQLFDLLLYGKKVEDGIYSQTVGIIEQNQGKDLAVFVSHDLSEGQYYCLLNEAARCNVNLRLFLAPNINLPTKIKTREFVIANPQTHAPANRRITITNDCYNIAIPKADGEIQEPLIIDIEDHSFQDLVFQIKFNEGRPDAKGFDGFKEVESEIATALKTRKVILRGKLAPDLLQMMEYAMVDAKSESFSRLHFVIQDNEISAKSTNYRPLAWLDRSKYEISYQEKTLSPQIKVEEIIDPLSNNLEAETSSAALQFMQERKRIFFERLQDSPMLKLVGHSGVGKSSLMREIAQEKSADVFYELSDFEKWASSPQDPANDRKKILFIDEANFEKMHFTMFSELKKGRSKNIFYQGKSYQLTEKHAVVFASNPKEYGGGRVEQDLFADNSIPEFHLQDFPRSYLYEKLLKEAIYDKIPEDKKNGVLEAAFKEECKKLLSQYQDTKSIDGVKLSRNELIEKDTARELQDQALRFLSKTLDQQRNHPKIKGKNFISTDATKVVEDVMHEALNLRQKQVGKILPAGGLGLNGILLEGDSGVGKSELIGEMLRSHNIEKSDIIKIEASAPFAKKKELILQAFDSGKIVWSEEDIDGLEKILNAVLTGFHPDTLKPAAKAGFMLISSVNRVDMEGRSLISPALMHRTLHPRVSDLIEYETQDLQEIILHWLILSEAPNEEHLLKNEDAYNARSGEIAEGFDILAIAKNFAEMIGEPEYSNWNLRMLKRAVTNKELLSKYVKEKVVIEEVLPIGIIKPELVESANPDPDRDRDQDADQDQDPDPDPDPALPPLLPVQEAAIANDSGQEVNVTYSSDSEQEFSVPIVIEDNRWPSDNNSPNTIPRNSAKIKSFSPLIGDRILDVKNIFANSLRGNKFKFLSAVYNGNDPQQEIEDVMKDILKSCYQEAKLSAVEFIGAIKNAKEVGGVAHKYLRDQEGVKSSPYEERQIAENMKKQARFSGLFQRKCQECGIFSGRGNSEIGLRVGFLPDSVTNSIIVNGKVEEDFLNLDVNQCQTRITTKKRLTKDIMKQRSEPPHSI